MDRALDWLRQRVRAAATLVVLAILMLLALAVGWAALTEPLPELDVEPDNPPACVARTILAGQRVGIRQVTVSVFNAGRTEGQASVTMAELATRGFGQGTTGNAPRDAEVQRVQIWAPDPQNPAVRLVRSHLGGRSVPVVTAPRQPLGPGVVIVIGDRFQQPARGAPFVQATRVARICSPTA